MMLCYSHVLVLGFGWGGVGWGKKFKLLADSSDSTLQLRHGLGFGLGVIITFKLLAHSSGAMLSLCQSSKGAVSSSWSTAEVKRDRSPKPTKPYKTL